VAEFPPAYKRRDRGSAVTYYRAYIVGEDGHFIESVNLDCTDDAAAVESAKRLVISRDVEVWQQGRMVTKLATNDNDPK
jgi:hypothetical protein